MYNCAIRVPETVTSERLKEDLVGIIEQHNGELGCNMEALTQWGLHDTRVYEIPATGTVTTMTNDTNHFEANSPKGIITYSAMILCSGFNENSQEFKELVADIHNLEKRYRI